MNRGFDRMEQRFDELKGDESDNTLSAIHLAG
jgi:hypothetical protein